MFYPLGAARWKVGYGYVRPWRQSFHALVAIHKIPFQYFTSQNHNSPPPSQFREILFLKISAEFCSKASNCAKIQFTWLNFVEKFGQLESQIRQSIHISPSVRPFGQPFYPKMKVECSRGFTLRLINFHTNSTIFVVTDPFKTCKIEKGTRQQNHLINK